MPGRSEAIGLRPLPACPGRDAGGRLPGALTLARITGLIPGGRLVSGLRAEVRPPQYEPERDPRDGEKNRHHEQNVEP